MKKTVIAYVMSPIHVISSLCAVSTVHQGDDVDVVLVLHWPGASGDMLEELKSVVETLAAGFSFVKKTMTVSNSTLTQLLSSVNRSTAISLLKNLLGEENIEEIYYSHDVMGPFYQLLSVSYDQARRICFGDAMGQVVEKQFHLSLLRKDIRKSNLSSTLNIYRQKTETLARNFAKHVLHLFKRRNLEAILTSQDIPPHEVALILPVDQTGNMFKGIKLTLCPRDLVITFINKGVTACSNLQDYIAGLLGTYRQRQCYLLLTDNFSEGNFISFDREIEMYCSIIAQHCPADAVIFLKSHPGETLQRNKMIKERLKHSYEIVELDKKFKRYPIELWKELVLNSTVICMSYPALSLKYLYNIDVIQPLDDAFVEHWFPEWTWASYKNAIKLYMVPLQKLSNWNGRSILYP